MGNDYRYGTVKSRLCYAKRFHSILIFGDAQSLIALAPETRLTVMKSLVVLAKYLGCINRWQEIRKNGGLNGLREWNAYRLWTGFFQ
jgi:hypothetical protein